jgi:alpha-tubulin suppressor-like RCC1 family protein
MLHASKTVRLDFRTLLSMVLWGAVAPSACKVFDPGLLDGSGSMVDAAPIDAPCEEDIQNDEANCGGCGDVCTFAHAAAGECTGGTCENACDEEWGDCDENDLSGCETALTSKRHCTGCGLTCPFACSGGCVGGTSMASGSNWSCALLDNGRARCWGANEQGQLGTNDRDARNAPADVIDMATAIGVVAGFGHSCALLEGRNAACWGQNDVGQLGDGSTTQRLRPVPVALEQIDDISVGFAHTCLRQSTRVWCWGFNDAGQLGLADETTRTSPTMLNPTETGDVTDLAVGLAHSCAIRTGGQVACWGFNDVGQAGSLTEDEGGTNEVHSPELVTGITDARQLYLGHSHSCATTTGGTVRCWGWNQSGQLGNGGFSNRTQPDTVRNEAGTALTMVDHVVAGPERTCAVVGVDAKSGLGDAYCWGDNTNGSLGAGPSVGAQSPRAVPVTAVGTAKVKDISVGVHHTCFMTETSIICVGANGEGQLGDGTTVSSATGVEVSF